MTKRVAWFTGEPSIKECFTPYKVYEVVREEDTNFSVINDKGVNNFCLKNACAHICHKDWVFADVVESVEAKQPKWSEWIENTTGKCPEGLKRKQKIKLKWSDGDKFVIDNPHDAAWYFSEGVYPVDITHYKVKLKSKWTKNMGVCPVPPNTRVEVVLQNGETLYGEFFNWGDTPMKGRKIIKWRLAD